MLSNGTVPSPYPASLPVEHGWFMHLICNQEFLGSNPRTGFMICPNCDTNVTPTQYDQCPVCLAVRISTDDWSMPPR